MKMTFLIPVFLMARVLVMSDSSLYEMIAQSPFVISKEKVNEILEKKSISINELLQELIPIAKTFARPAISHYQVGVAALGKSGNIYLGVNLEFDGHSLNETVHGEQFLVVNARNHEETELVAIALSAAPCGHCRQFLHEIGISDDLLIITPNSSNKTLSSLLPESFGPQDLGLTATLMQISEERVMSEGEVSLATKALEAARKSYAPYTASKSGIAIQTKDGSIYTGSCLENAAFNPSLSPLQTALVELVADMKDYSDIIHVILAEQQLPKVSHEVVSCHVVKSIAPDAIFERITTD